MLNKIINKLTDRDKLLQEINEVQAKLIQSDNIKKAALNDLSKSQQVIQKLQLEKQQKVTKLENQIQRLERYILSLKLENERLTDSENKYKSRFGEMTFSPPFEDKVDDWDEDKSFFEQIEKIKGNPFNQHQIQAIRYNLEKHLRIIAGAGSGKTETICAKTAYLITMEDVQPSRICMVTFTRKAADEMKERVNTFLGTENSNVRIGTFHSIFQTLFTQLVKQVPACASVGVTGKKEEDSDEKFNKLLRGLIKQYNLFNFEKHGEKSIKERIDYWTNLGYTPENMRSFIMKHYDMIEEKSEYPISQRFYDMYIRFNQIRTEEKIVVFDDYLLNLYYALKEYKSAREFVQGKFDYIFVDEFQDINPLQMDILKLISEPAGDCAKLIIVGDDDQSIYAFRGSDPCFIKQFHEIYTTHTIELMTNYRSKQNIVQAGNKVIASNVNDRIQKAMAPFHKSNGEAFIWAANDPSDEANWIISKAQEIGKKKPFVFNGRVEQVNYTSSTILYRSVGQLQSVYQVLDSRAVPYVIENSEDVMGIFNISEFKYVFRSWNDMVCSNDSRKYVHTWRAILLNIANAYYIRTEKFNQFLQSYDFNSFQQLFSDFSSFIKKEKPKNDTEYIVNYLNALMKVASKTPVLLNEVIEPFFQFPKVKKEMSKEEMDWITKEFNHCKTWEALIAYYHRLQEKRITMKKHLELYHKGEYNALSFVTIHKSKGLAYENVFVIGVYDGGLPSKRAVPLGTINMTLCREKAEPPTTIEEERRLMYVAVTRAKQNLYVTFPKTIQGKPCRRSIFLKELNLKIEDQEK
ncbi:UvrD-helicase domain-containing protein [Brevibacillus brevis]|uniref:UvrD-helicase domain-containing protein n=1 Tax=Brevibacillus brevis TaxID=1393 RepID=UPI0019015057|nr:ATP-dependent helicase [Brevibacillus brevis]